MRTVGNVVEGAMPKQTIETIPRRTVIITLRWSLMIDFKNPQNYKKNKKERKTVIILHILQIHITLYHGYRTVLIHCHLLRKSHLSSHKNSLYEQLEEACDGFTAPALC